MSSVFCGCDSNGPAIACAADGEWHVDPLVHVTMRALAEIRGEVDVHYERGSKNACGAVFDAYRDIHIVHVQLKTPMAITCPRCLVAADAAREGRTVDVRKVDAAPVPQEDAAP